MSSWFRPKFTEEEKEFLRTQFRDKSLEEVRRLFKEKYGKDISLMTLSRLRSKEKRTEEKEEEKAEDLNKYIPQPSEVNYVFQFPREFTLTEEEELEYVQILNLKIPYDEKQRLLRNLAERIKQRVQSRYPYPVDWVRRKRRIFRRLKGPRDTSI